MLRARLFISSTSMLLAAIFSHVHGQGWGGLPTVEFQYGRGGHGCDCRDGGLPEYRGRISPRRDWAVSASWQPYAYPGYRDDVRPEPRFYDRVGYTPGMAYGDPGDYRPVALPIRYTEPRYDVPLDIAPFVSYRPQDTDGMYLGKGLFGQPRAFARDEPVRNLFRYLLP